MPEASHILPETVTDQDPNVTLMSAPVSDGHESVYQCSTWRHIYAEAFYPWKETPGLPSGLYRKLHLTSLIIN